MRDLITACSAGKVDDCIVLDLMDTEDKLGLADVPVALMPNKNAITLLQMDGILTPDEFESAVNLAVDGCQRIYAMQKEVLKAKYVGAKEVEE
jgi:exosome complex component RRP41